MSEYILVTDWEQVDEDDFYLEDEWLDGEGMSKEDKEDLRSRAKDGNLYIGYVVKAISYAIYSQMDAHQIFIDGNMNEVLSCESAVIDNNHDKRIEYDY